MCKENFTLIFGILAVGSKTLTYLTGPLWLDFFNSSETDSRRINPFYAVLSQALFPLLFFSFLILHDYLTQRSSTWADNASYPHKEFAVTGFGLAISALILNFSLSGTRTAPYLQALLGNFLIPIQFVARLFILRRRPTPRKCLCALTVMLAEFVSLVPSIFPSLMSAESQQNDGGASGPGRILWPLAFVIAFIPATVSNSLMERSVKTTYGKKDQSGEDMAHYARCPEPRQINMVYYMFWCYLYTVLPTIVLFWWDIIPEFGSSQSINSFWDSMTFNFACFFGRAGCGMYVVILGWASLLTNVVYTVTVAYLLRYSEGANYMTVAMTLRSPILFLTWTLFDEANRLRWHPHMSLSTWLSIGALLIMIPAVYLYNTGPPEYVLDDSSDDDTEKLLHSNVKEINGFLNDKQSNSIDSRESAGHSY